MIGLNGGLIGAKRSTSILASNTGVWSPLEQLKARRNGLWPGSVVTNNLVFYIDSASAASYPGSGTAITDLSGNSNNLTGTSTLGLYYEDQGAFAFDGVTSWATAASNAFLPNNLFADGGGSWTVSCWFKFPTTPFGARGSGEAWTLVGRGGGLGGSSTFMLFVDPLNRLACIIRGVMTVIALDVNTNTWNYVSVTWNGTSGSLYFNNASPGVMSVGTAALQATVPFVVGSGGSTPRAGLAYSGNIAQVAIYSSALSATDIARNYAAISARFTS